MIKLIAIDLDGTTLNKDMRISDENLTAIHKALKMDIKVIIATGRPKVFTTLYKDMFNTNLPFIMYNGGEIYDFYKDESLYDQLLKPTIIEETLDMLEQHNTAYMLYGEKNVYYKPCPRVEFLKSFASSIPLEHRATFVEIIDYKDILEIEPFHKVLIVEQNEEIYRDVHKRVINLRINADIVRSSSFYIEVIPKGVSKGNAVKKLAELYSINQSEVMTIGDQENDISMIKYAGIGVAMCNATEGVKEVADYVTLSNIENGVAYAINKFALNTGV